MNLATLICRRNGAAKGEQLAWKLVHSATLANWVKLNVLWRSVPSCTWGTAAYDLPQQNVTKMTRESRDDLCKGGITESAPSRCPSSPRHLSCCPSPLTSPRLSSTRVPALQGLSHLLPSPGTADDSFPSNHLCLSFTRPLTPNCCAPSQVKGDTGACIHGDKLNFEGESPGFPCPAVLCGQHMECLHGCCSER